MKALILAACASVAMIAPRASAQDVVPREEIEQGLRPVTGEATASIDLPILFALDSADLTDSAIAQITELAAAMTSDALSTATFGVYGHTDSSGAAAYNLELSRRRADAVRLRLIEVHAIASDRLVSEGFGESRPALASAPASPRNRRVEIVVLSRGAPAPTDEDRGLTPVGGDPG